MSLARRNGHSSTPKKSISRISMGARPCHKLISPSLASFRTTSHPIPTTIPVYSQRYRTTLADTHSIPNSPGTASGTRTPAGPRREEKGASYACPTTRRRGDPIVSAARPPCPTGRGLLSWLRLNRVALLIFLCKRGIPCAVSEVW